MTSFIGKKFNVFNANSFATSFMSDAIYLYVGRVLAWDTETSPPVANDTTYNHNKIWDNMCGVVRVNRDQVALGIKRNDWTTGTVYNKYHHANTNAQLATGNGFYVLAGLADRDVYKCLDNDGESYSSVKPTHKNLGATKENDGYVWKYMYSIENAQFTQFATSYIIPVFIDTDVANFSKRNSILHLPISAKSIDGIGKEYRGTGFSNGTVGVFAVNPSIYTTVFSNSATYELTVNATSGLAIHDDYYNDSAFLITSGKAKGTYRLIADSKKGATDSTSNLVLSSVVSNIANGDTFIIGPKVFVSDDINGIGFLGIAEVNSSGNVTAINTSLTGKNYANGDAVVLVNGDYHPTTASFEDGSGATVELIIPPSGGGHGFNPLMELDAKYVIVSPETPLAKDHQTGQFVGYGNEIRQIGLIRNPIDKSTNQIADKESYDLRTSIYFEHPTDINFVKDQTVYNRLIEEKETAMGVIDAVCGEEPRQYISLSRTQGRFIKGDVIYNRLGDSATISDVSLEYHPYPITSISTSPDYPVKEGGLAKYTGDILYHENISPITRRLDQKENFKFIFEF